MTQTLARFLVLSAAVIACGPSSRPELAPPADAPHEKASRSQADAPLAPVAHEEGVESASSSDAGAAPALAPPVTSAAPKAPAAPVDANVKVVTIGMHVGGGPFDELTKEPFKKVVEPHFPEMAQCWGKHVPKPPKQGDVGVDLLIEATGGHPKVSNPRSTFEKSETEGLLPCVVAVFESVEFPKLDRGRTGVSYSLRFTKK
jgi:hypothetical protein